MAGIAPLPVYASEHAAPGITDEKAIRAINHLAGPDGAAIERPLFGTSVLSGVLMDRTITLPGSVFYRAFSRAALGNPIFNTATLAVMERPDPRRGSQIWVTEGSHIHFQTRLSPRINDAGNTARDAVDIVQKALLARRIGAALSSDRDLGREELQP